MRRSDGLNEIVCLLMGVNKVCPLNDLDFSMKHKVVPFAKAESLEVAGGRG